MNEGKSVAYPPLYSYRSFSFTLFTLTYIRLLLVLAKADASIISITGIGFLRRNSTVDLNINILGNVEGTKQILKLTGEIDAYTAPN